MRRTKILLLSGLLCDRTMWTKIAQALADRYDVDIVDFIGFTSIEAMAEHVLDRAPERFILVGHSMGGRVGFEVLRRAPTRIIAAVMMNTGIHPRRDGEAEGRYRLAQLAEQRGMAALAAVWLPPMMGQDRARTERLMPPLTQMVERSTPESFRGQIEALLNRPDPTSILGDIACPVLLMSGSDDSWSPIAQHQEIQAKIPRAELIAIENAGHMMPIERPDAIADTLMDWLARIS